MSMHPHLVLMVCCACATASEDLTARLEVLGQPNTQVEALPLAIYHGRLYVGGGSTNNGTNSTHLSSYDLSAGTWSQWPGDIHYELIAAWRVLSDGNLYAPMVDPSNDDQLLRLTPDHRVEFIEARGINIAHDNDIFLHDGRLFTAGSRLARTPPGVCWRGANGGAWTAPPDQVGDSVSITSFIAMHGRLFAIDGGTFSGSYPNTVRTFVVWEYDPTALVSFRRHLEWHDHLDGAAPLEPDSRYGFSRPDGAWVQIDHANQGVAVVTAMAPSIQAQRIRLTDAGTRRLNLARSDTMACMAVSEFPAYNNNNGTVRLLTSPIYDCITWTEIGNFAIDVPLAPGALAVDGDTWYFGHGQTMPYANNVAKTGTIFRVRLDRPTTDPGDANADGRVDAADLAIVGRQFGRAAEEISDTRADRDGDQRVTAVDMQLVLAGWTP